LRGKKRHILNAVFKAKSHQTITVLQTVSFHGPRKDQSKAALRWTVTMGTIKNIYRKKIALFKQIDKIIQIKKVLSYRGLNILRYDPWCLNYKKFRIKKFIFTMI
jgi:hypothetical protein